MKIEEIIGIPQILIPNGSVDYEKWAVIACDQYTSKKEYWEELEEFVDKSPSTLNLIFPEAYLSQNNQKRIQKINDTMDSYVKRNLLRELPQGFMLVVRQTPFNECRVGIVLSVDLEKYSFEKKPYPIRATEATIIERIPPRVKIRENAILEFPHIMLLIDDKQRLTIEPIYNMRDRFEKVYDFDLNQNGGHITGYFIDDTQLVMSAFAKLIVPATLTEKYGDETPFLFAVGDGNHSLATAKVCWEQLKSNLTEEEKANHPSRFALVEVVNLYDEGLTFEPIHRIVSNVNTEDFMARFNECATGSGVNVEIVKHSVSSSVRFGATVAESIAKVDAFINEYKKTNPEIIVDYIHGEDDLMELVDKDNRTIGILLDKLEKEMLFPAIINGGSLAKKSFSMGEAAEKRYYIEGRKIK